MGTIIKNFCSFKENIDFNFISNLLDRNNLYSTVSSNWIDSFMLESVFKIKNIENDYFFNEIFNLLNSTYNRNKKKSDMDIFFSFVSGGKSITHKDEYDVFILGLYGRTIYRVEEKEFFVEPGDLISIPKNKLHKAIGITPRICLSYGVYDN